MANNTIIMLLVCHPRKHFLGRVAFNNDSVILCRTNTSSLPTSTQVSHCVRLRSTIIISQQMIPVAIILMALVGSALGLLGSGGSIVTLPVLVYVAGVPSHQAVDMSLVIVGG